MSRSSKILIVVFLLPFILGLVIFYIIPFFVSIYYSLTSGNGNVEFVGFQNYIDLFKNSAFRLAFKNTMIFISISVPLVMVISFSIAMLINKGMKGIRFFRTTFTLPLVIPVVTIVLFWQVLFADNGVVNSFLEHFNIEGVNWFKSQYSMIILIMLYVWKNSAFNIILFLVGLNNIPNMYYESARVDGCNRKNEIFKITIPLLLPTIVLNLTISIINCFKVYREAYILCGEYPSNSLYMLQHFMNNNFSNFNYQRLCTASIITFSIIAIMIFLLIRFERNREVSYE